ncbi:MAG: PHP domain-containing protein [bacterium]|nr:PHP domain-containing protein [bacterium]
MILKTNLHFHSKEDPVDGLHYSIYQAVDYAEKLNFGALAITSHRTFSYKKEYGDYARGKNILLIPGIEANIEGKHIVILNCDKDSERIKSFDELKNYKKMNTQIFVLVPHPFVSSAKSLGGELLEKHIDLFDAIELSIFSNKIFDFNKKAEEAAEKYKKPLIATSDTHSLGFLNRGYTLVDAEERTIDSLFDSIKKYKMKNEIINMPLTMMARFHLKGLLVQLKNPAAKEA